MTRRAMWSRRHLIGATLATTGLAMRPVVAQEATNSDRGLGGTGVAPPDPEGSDRGIGGTGVVGTIRRFGSIVVNDLRVTFPRSVAVRIDGKPARLRDLAVGHVVHVLARQDGAHLSTRLIDVVSEASGPIDTVDSEGFSVLGQKVIVPDEKLLRRWKAHAWVSVSGLRRLDGTIMASRVEKRVAGPAQLVGVPRLELDGSAWLGDLPLHGFSLNLAGQRLILTGQLVDDRLVVVEARPPWTELLAAQPDRLSVEDYVALDNGVVRFGSGFPSTSDLAIGEMHGETRAVVSASVAPGGHIQVLGIRVEGHTQQSGSSASPPNGSRSPDQSPGRPGSPGMPGSDHRGFGYDPGHGPGGPASRSGAPSPPGSGERGGGPFGGESRGGGPGAAGGSRR